MNFSGTDIELITKKKVHFNQIKPGAKLKNKCTFIALEIFQAKPIRAFFCLIRKFPGQNKCIKKAPHFLGGFRHDCIALSSETDAGVT